MTVSSPGGMYFATTELTLTCAVEIASALGSVAVTTMWMGPQGMLPGTNVTTGGNSLRYESMLTVDSLPTTSTATYICTAMVDVMPSNQFITASIETDSLEISIGRQILSHCAYYLVRIWHIIQDDCPYTVLAPTAPVIMTPKLQTDSILITWSQATEDIVQNYEISYAYDGPCPNVTVSASVTLDSTTTSYNIMVSDLEEFSTYTITVTAINPAGTTNATRTATTLLAST